MNTDANFKKIYQLQEKILSWAKHENNIKAVAMIGSYARNNPEKDSDVDFIILTNTPGYYIKNANWLNYFGEVKEFEIAFYGNVTSLHARYIDFPKVEFSFTDENWIAIPPHQDTLRIIMNGMKVIYDKKNLFSQFIDYLVKIQPEITFRLATINDKSLIWQWWTKPHVIEFWDNSPNMWQNVENYFQGKKNLFDYWIGFLGKTPFCLLMTSEIEKNLPPDDPYFKWVKKNGITMGVDFMIGEEAFLGKGLGHLTLREFSSLLHEMNVTRLIIDPAETNSRAKHVYQKAGFEIVDTFSRTHGYFSGIRHYLMIKNL